MSQGRTTKLHKGDCITLLAEMDPGSFDLIYMDPPFFTQKKHRLKTRDRTQEFSFDDLWASNQAYAEFILARLKQLHRVLSPKGSIFFHCDRKATHLARALLDEVFGPANLRAEIIWQYRRWSNSQEGLLPAHQTIYYYTKSSRYTFNVLWQEYSPSTNIDQILQRRTRDVHGKAVYHRDASGEIVTNGAKKGVPLGDVWDIPYLNPKARERTGYPTQKPVLLLERIIEIASNPGDRVLDPFCGSGTTLVAASLLDRSSVGIDVSEEAIALTRSRLKNPVRSDSNLLKFGRESYRQTDQLSTAVLSGLGFVPVHRNKGIDAILKEDLVGTPIPIRVQRPHESVAEAAQLLFRASRTKKARVMFLVIMSHEAGLPDFPPGVIPVESTAAAVRTRLAELRQDPPRPIQSTAPLVGENLSFLDQDVFQKH